MEKGVYFPAHARDELTKYAGDRPKRPSLPATSSPQTGTPRDGGALVDAQAETSHARAEIGGARVKQALARTFVSQVLSGRKQSKDSAQLAITNTCVDDG